MNSETLDRVRQLLRNHQGPCPVFICFLYPDGHMVFMETDEGFFVTPTEALVHDLESMLGEDTVWLKVDNERMNELKDNGRNGRSRKPAAA